MFDTLGKAETKVENVSRGLRPQVIDFGGMEDNQNVWTLGVELQTHTRKVRGSFRGGNHRWKLIARVMSRWVW